MTELDLSDLTSQIYSSYGSSYTIKGGSRRAEKSCKVLMMMKAAKLGWAGAGAGPGRAEAGQGRSRAEVGTGLE